MAYYYGQITRSSRKTPATASSTEDKGLTVEALTWEGGIRVSLCHDSQGNDRYIVEKIPHPSGSGKQFSSIVLHEGTIQEDEGTKGQE